METEWVLDRGDYDLFKDITAFTWTEQKYKTPQSEQVVVMPRLEPCAT